MSGDGTGGADRDADDPSDDQPDWSGDGEDDAAEAPVSDGGGAYEVEGVDPYSGPGSTPSGPTPGAPDDEEMPLADHVEEMIRRLGVVIVVAGLVSGVVFPFAEHLINFLWYSFLPGSTAVCPAAVDPDPAYPYSVVTRPDAACPYVYHPLSLMFARIKVASLVGLIVALPVLVYESYLFMRPGLYPRERKYYLASVPTSLVLALVGVTFAYLVVLPTLFIYFTGYTDQAAEVAFGLTETFNLIVMMMGFFAIVFQIPLLIMLAVMMGVTSRRWLADRRLYFYGGFATVAFLFSPDPTGMAPILVAVTMILLFEGTLLILRWTGDESPVPTAAGLAARRPAVYTLAVLAGYLTSSAPVPAGYYGQLPGVVTGALASAGLVRATPLVIGLALVGVYELVAYLARRRRVDRRVRRALARGRALAWPLALVVGYFGSPDPVLLVRVRALEFGLVRVGLVVGALVVLYELTTVGLARREAE
jgi:sec-independent protein translocase protein TatC